MPLDLSHPELRFALNAVKTVVSAVRQVERKNTSNKMTKKDDSPVTVGDFAGQSIVGYLLSQSFENDPLIGEEGAESLKKSEGKHVLAQVTEIVKRFIPEATPEAVCRWIDRGNGNSSSRFWTVDPIDGTKGFLRGDHYAVALALIVNGKVELGVLGCPHLSVKGETEKNGPGALFAAVRGQGAWAASFNEPEKFEQIQVSGEKDKKKVRLLRSAEPAHTNISKTERFLKEMGIEVEAIAMDSQAKYAKLAAGKAETFFYLVPKDRPAHRMKIWDVAAGSILVEEAGGKVTDLEGHWLDFGVGNSLKNNPGIFVTNGHLHEVILETLQAVLGANA